MNNGAYSGPPFPELEVHNIKGLRFYETPTGEKYPSITTVLGKQPGKQKGLQEWRERVGVAQAQIISGKAARRGSVFHNIVENYLLDKDISDFKQQNFMAWCMFGEMKSHLDEKINQVVLQEQTMFSSKFKVAGRCDLIGVYKDKLSVVDFKTTTRTKKEEWIDDYFIQCAAYASMFEEHTGEPVEDVVIMMVAEDGEVQLFEKKTADYLPKLEELMDDFYETIVSDLQAA
mgnify:FL=1